MNKWWHEKKQTMIIWVFLLQRFKRKSVLKTLMVCIKWTWITMAKVPKIWPTMDNAMPNGWNE